MAPRISSSAEKVLIEHIPVMKRDQGMENDFIRSAQLLLQALGKKYRYDYLMGISGAAFRLHLHPELCPSALDPTTGFDVSRILFPSIGFRCHAVRINDQKFEEIRSLYHRLMDHIDRGIPVLGINLMGFPEWGLVTGYLKNRPGILCRSLDDEAEEYSNAERAPWLTFFLEEGGKPLDEETLLLNSLELALRQAKTEEFDGYFSGLAAFSKWIGLLTTASKKNLERMTEKSSENLLLLNQLIDSRRAACEYLHHTSGEFRLRNREAMEELYREEVRLLEQTRQTCTPGSDEYLKKWTQEEMDALADGLSRTLQLEEHVTGLISEALYS